MTRSDDVSRILGRRRRDPGGVTRYLLPARPDAAAWAEQLKLRRSGAEYVGACPVCGDGDDRFHVRDAGDRVGLIGCRHCGSGDPGWYQRALSAAGFADADLSAVMGTRQPVPRRLSAPRPKPVSEHDPRTAALARSLLSAAVEIPDAVRVGWRRGLIGGATPTALRWLDQRTIHGLGASVPVGSVGALVAPLGGDAAACQLIHVDEQLAKVVGCDKRTYGPAKCRGFRVSGSGDTLRIVEGVADALAVDAVLRRSGGAGTVVAAVGSAGLRDLPLAALKAFPGRWGAIVLTPDAEDAEAMARAHGTVEAVSRLAPRVGADLRSVEVDTRWYPDPAAVWESGGTIR